MKFTAKAAGGLYDPYTQKNPYYEKWEKLVNDFSEKASPGINKPRQTAGLDWCIMISEIKLVETMYQGLYISITFCVIALTVATMNIIQAILSALTIGLIIVNTMAMVAYQGWELGAAESVGVVVCVGFAVDYVVHLAAHFVHSKAKDRNSRVRESLREIGISILSGSVTTVAATATLYICVLVLFSKFATLVIYTIALSTFYSLAFFAALCHAIGPMGNLGNIKIVYDIAKEKIQACYQNRSSRAEGNDQLEDFKTPRNDQATIEKCMAIADNDQMKGEQPEKLNKIFYGDTMA